MNMGYNGIFDMGRNATPNRVYRYIELYNEIADETNSLVGVETIRQKIERDKDGIKCKLKEFFHIDITTFPDTFSVLQLLKLYWGIEYFHEGVKLNQVLSASKELDTKHKEAVAELKSELELGLSAKFISSTTEVFRLLENLWAENLLMFTKRYILNFMKKSDHD